MSPIVGGIDTFILNVFLNLRGRYKFEFLNTSNNPLAYSNIIKRYGGKIINIPLKQSHFRYLTRYYYAKKFFKYHHYYSLIHLNTATINKMFWIKAAKKYGIKHFIIHSHANSSDKSSFYKRIAKILVKQNQHYLRRNTNIVKWAASISCGRWMFGKNQQFQIINNGINTKNFVHNKYERIRIRHVLSININDKVIITTSRIVYQKNYPKIIKVFFYIHKVMPQSKLVIIGTGDDLYKIKQMVKLLGILDSVYFLGEKNRKEIPKYLNIADLMLMPSFHEGMPFAIVESQAAGVPVLASEGIPECSNVTNQVKYLSLKLSDKIWAKFAVDMLRVPYNINMKLKMNEYVCNSRYALINSIKEVSLLYSNIIDDN